MSTEFSKNNQLKRVRTIADFQFGRGVGCALFPDNTEFRLSSTKRIRYILLDGERLATLRAHDGRLTLSIQGAKRLSDAISAPAYRVKITEFLMKGKNAMAKHVVSADENIHAGDEVMVTGEDGSLIATGSAVLSGREMLAFNYGVAVNVRKGSK